MSEEAMATATLLGKSRRVAVLRVSPDYLVEALKVGQARTYEVVEHGLPRDAKAVRVSYDAASDTVRILVESEEFAEIFAGEVAPWLPLPQLRLLRVSNEV